jgi:hypothetical protein
MRLVLLALAVILSGCKDKVEQQDPTPPVAAQNVEVPVDKVILHFRQEEGKKSFEKIYVLKPDGSIVVTTRELRGEKLVPDGGSAKPLTNAKQVEQIKLGIKEGKIKLEDVASHRVWIRKGSASAISYAISSPGKSDPHELSHEENEEMQSLREYVLSMI